MHQSYLDAMAIVQVFGKPDLFVTMTCNPNWVEIKNNLRFNEESSNRVDLTARVFNMKLNAVLDDIYKKGIFGKVVANIHVIEFQKRGLPHAHILIILEGQYKFRSTDDFDNIVCAEIPDPITQPRLYSIVTDPVAILFIIERAKKQLNQWMESAGSITRKNCKRRHQTAKILSHYTEEEIVEGEAS